MMSGLAVVAHRRRFLRGSAGKHLHVKVKELGPRHVEWIEHPGWVLAPNKKQESSCLKGLGLMTPDNGKPVVRQGRKATGLHSEVAGLPKETP